MSTATPDFAARRARVLEHLAKDSDGENFDGLLITDLNNVRYLTGFSGSAGTAFLATDGQTFFATDSRYAEQVKTELDPGVEVEITSNYAGSVVSAALGTRGGLVGIDDANLTVAQLAGLRDEFAALAHGIEFHSAGGHVEQARRIKDDVEVEIIARACTVADEAWTALVEAGQITAGRTERQVAADLEWHMRQAGSDGVSFDTIVGSGPNGALPHYHAGDRELASGDLVVVDFGAYVFGYASDCTRTVGIGTLGDWQREIYEVTLAAQRAGTSAVIDGTTCKDADSAAREVISDAGFGEYFGHSLGHGVGLDVHESPGLSQSSSSTLLRGDVVTVEPGIYLPGRGGVRIEDTMVVTDGAPRVLTTTSKELLEL
ncbi:M24 family metallopeptidase [Dietzia timorensis]|uniref:Putative peptidase YqhT n=1 Tax=Dietzia timorensis TaxID=499555 RepID=A0A173LMI9_9ACTN|nr:aminopeptidase P family protein [Dietzia timorensis]ANI92507.1 putative peptidase YqhT [Dietzia timorensis]